MKVISLEDIKPEDFYEIDIVIEKTTTLMKQYAQFSYKILTRQDIVNLMNSMNAEMPIA